MCGSVGGVIVQVVWQCRWCGSVDGVVVVQQCRWYGSASRVVMQVVWQCKSCGNAGGVVVVMVQSCVTATTLHQHDTNTVYRLTVRKVKRDKLLTANCFYAVTCNKTVFRILTKPIQALIQQLQSLCDRQQFLNDLFFNSKWYADFRK